MIILKYFFEAQILNIHDLNTNLSYLSSNVLSLYCVFDGRNLVLCLTRELIKAIDYKIMLKLGCKTTFNSAFIGKKNHQNRTRVDFVIMFLKYVVLYEIYTIVKYYSDRILFACLCICLNNSQVICLNNSQVICLNNSQVICLNNSQVICLNNSQVVCLNNSQVICLNNLQVICLNNLQVICLNNSQVVCLNNSQVICFLNGCRFRPLLIKKLFNIFIFTDL